MQWKQRRIHNPTARLHEAGSERCRSDPGGVVMEGALCWGALMPDVAVGGQ